MTMTISLVALDINKKELVNVIKEVIENLLEDYLMAAKIQCHHLVRSFNQWDIFQKMRCSENLMTVKCKQKITEEIYGMPKDQSDSLCCSSKITVFVDLEVPPVIGYICTSSILEKIHNQ